MKSTCPKCGGLGSIEGKHDNVSKCLNCDGTGYAERPMVPVEVTPTMDRGEWLHQIETQIGIQLGSFVVLAQRNGIDLEVVDTMKEMAHRLTVAADSLSESDLEQFADEMAIPLKKAGDDLRARHKENKERSN